MANSTMVTSMDNVTMILQQDSMDVSLQLDPAVSVIVAVYLIITGFLGILLNGMVILILSCRKQPMKGAELFILKLCLIELMQVVFAFPVIIFYCLSDLPLTTAACNYEAFVVFYCGCTSIWTLTMLSLYRFIKICHAHNAPKNDKKLVILSIVLINVMSLTWSLTPFLGWGSYGLELHGLSCALDWQHLSSSYIVSIFMVCYGLPVTIIVYAYINIAYTVVHSRKRTGLKLGKSDIHLAKVAMTMCITFFSSWTPYAIITLMGVYAKAVWIPPLLTVFAPIFAKSNTFLNPIIYFLALKSFRKDVFKLLFFQSFNNKIKVNGPERRVSFGTDPMMTESQSPNQTMPRNGQGNQEVYELDTCKVQERVTTA